VSVISALDVFDCLFVMLRIRVHASFILSHDVISFQLNLRETLHDSGSLSVRFAMILSQINNWLLSMLTLAHQKILISCVLTVIFGAASSILSLMLIFFEFPAASLTTRVRVQLSLRVVHDVISFQFNDSEVLQFLVTSSFRVAISSSPMKRLFPIISIFFHHVISISDLLKEIVGAVVSLSSSAGSSLLHAVNRLAAVQIHTLVVIAHVSGAVVVMVLTDVGKNEDATIHVVVKALLIALLVLSINLAALLLLLADSWECRLFNLVMEGDILYIKIIILIILLIILYNKSRIFSFPKNLI
jgi:hypothetical protein